MSFITSKSDFDHLVGRSAEIFGVKPPGLPELTFASSLDVFRVVEFDVMFTRSFWRFLVALAQEAGDSSIALLVREPDPVAYFDHFGRYGCLQFPLTTSPDEVNAVIRAGPGGSTADSVFHVGNVVSWFGDRGAWGVWGDRNLGIAIVAIDAGKVRWPGDSIDWFTIDQAMRELVPLTFKNRIVPPNINQRLRKAYDNG